MTGAEISPSEVSIIRRLDSVILSVINKTGAHKRDVATEADVADQKMAVRAAGKERRVVKRT